MAIYTTSIEVAASAPVVLDYLADFASITQWDPSVREAHLVAGLPGKEDARYNVTLGFGPWRQTLSYHLVRYLAASETSAGQVQLRAENAHIVSFDTITVTPVDANHCVMTYEAKLTPQGFRKVFDPGFALMMQLIGTRAAAGLRRELAALATRVAGQVN